MDPSLEVIRWSGLRTDKENAVLPAPAPRATPREETIDLGQRVELALRATGYLPLRAVEVFVNGPLAILKGRVPSYYLKQIAQTAALTVPGVLTLRNDVQVIRPS